MHSIKAALQRIEHIRPDQVPVLTLKTSLLTVAVTPCRPRKDISLTLSIGGVGLCSGQHPVDQTVS